MKSAGVGPDAPALKKALAEAQVIVAVGSGGVGKTTSAAAIAIAAARMGRSCAVLTIDPAKRLAQALGLDNMGNQPQALPSELVQPGAVDAMMLETAGAFDDLIKKLVVDRDRQERLLTNRLYLLLARHLGGTHEYMAVEKLFELVNERNYDLVVLDTPPSVNALDFLDAPERITSFFSDRIQRYFIRREKERFGFIDKMKNRAGEMALGLLSKALGDLFVADVQDFATAFQTLFASFRERGLAVQELFKKPSTVFTVITGPDPVRVSEALRFSEALEKNNIRPDAFIMNRVHRMGPTDPIEFTHAELSEALDAIEGGADVNEEQLIEILEDSMRTQSALSARDQTGVTQMVRTIGRYRLLVVPELHHEVQDRDALEHVIRVFET
jgi:anion-transporting  ArsA/GET3 family ATPase